ncbi:MAG: 30S ribosomal protein S16 [Patescibacteria group bacterium]|jgi:small subunit ribosomal protein S16
MSLKIRLSRFGKTNAPTYKVVVSETKDKRNGRAVDIIGHFNPLKTPVEVQIDKDKLQNWKKNGAQTTPAVDKLLEGKYSYTKYSPKKAKGSDTEATNTKKAPEGAVEAAKEAQEA